MELVKPALVVYVVESPSAEDFFLRRSEAALITQALDLDDIVCVARTVTSRSFFEKALVDGLPEALQGDLGRWPVLHISAHGNGEGIGFTDGSEMDWEELHELLATLNGDLGGNLLLCVSACEGVSAKCARPRRSAALPYQTLVGHRGKPTWGDTAVGFAAFYHLIAKGCSPNIALKGLQAATNDEDWTLATEHNADEPYLDRVQATPRGIVWRVRLGKRRQSRSSAGSRVK